VNTSDSDTQDIDGRRRRRQHSAAFKKAVIAECRRPGVSIAAVALRHRLNANLLRRWIVTATDDGRPQGAAMPEAAAGSSPRTELEAPEFIPVSVVHPVAKDAQLQIDIRRGALNIRVRWPVSAAAQCGAWLREVLK
jgi:transposase